MLSLFPNIKAAGREVDLFTVKDVSHFKPYPTKCFSILRILDKKVKNPKSIFLAYLLNLLCFCNFSTELLDLTAAKHIALTKYGSACSNPFITGISNYRHAYLWLKMGKLSESYSQNKICSTRPY